MHLVEKIANFKIEKCSNPAHYYPSGGPTPAAQGCLDHHGDIVDRRRHLLSQKCFELVGGQAVSEQELLLIVINAVFTESKRGGQPLFDSPLFMYSPRMCTNYEHFKSVKTRQQQHNIEMCRFSHNKLEQEFHILTLD